MKDRAEELDRAGTVVEPLTSSSLLERVRQHDSDAWLRFVRLYFPLIFDWCRLSGLQSHDSVDVAQEVFRALWQNVGSYRREDGKNSFRGYVRGITRHKLADYWRKRQKHSPGEGGTDARLRIEEVAQAADDPADTGRLSESAALARRAMELVRVEFEDRTWSAFFLTTIDGRPVADIASELDMTNNAVYVAKSRVLSRLRQELEGLMD